MDTLLPPKSDGTPWPGGSLASGDAFTRLLATLHVEHRARTQGVKGAARGHLLADERGYRWATSHDCYLQRLRTIGVGAYFSDPATCAAPR